MVRGKRKQICFCALQFISIEYEEEKVSFANDEAILEDTSRPRYWLLVLSKLCPLGHHKKL